MRVLDRKVPLKALLIPLAMLILALAVSACGGGEDNNEKAHKQEAEARKASFTRLANLEPAHEMRYSPSRATINFWIDTWGKHPNKLSYVYLQAANGQLTGYYIFKGLPVSYCAALTENYEFVDPKEDDTKELFMVPAPGVDGVYYSGGQCDAYYGRDASTGAYIEYTAGGSQNVLVYDRPLPRQNVEPLGFAEINEFK